MLWKILALNMDNIYKKICIERLIRLRGNSNNFVSHGPIALMYNVCLKYSLNVHVMDILNGKIISNTAWKGLVNSAIMERENTMWSISVCLYSSLRLYGRVFPMIGLCHWWHLADNKPHLRQCCQSVVQAITGGCVYHYRNPKCIFNKCILCDGEDSVEHLLWGSMIKG